jgi:signal transduction histidine kinase
MLDKSHIDTQELISESAHALRSPVNTILNNAGFIVRGIEPDLLLEDAKEIQTAASQLSTLIDTVTEILECGNKDYHWMAFDIAELVEETCLKVQQSKDFKTIEFRSLVSCLLPRVWADGESVCRIIELLLVNQARASKRNVIYIQAHAEDACVVVTIGNPIKNSGSHVELPSLYTKKELGLELLLCCHLLTLNHGDLWATLDNSDLGTEVNLRFSIPKAQSPAS